MKSRFNLFSDSEKEVIRMALRRFSDDMFNAEMLGFEPSEKTIIASTLIYELVKGL